MKQWFRMMALALTLMMLFPAAPAAAEERSVLADIEYTSAAQVGDRLFFLGGRLYACDGDKLAEAAGALFPEADLPELILVNGGEALHVLNTVKGSLFRIAQGKAELVRQFEHSVFDAAADPLERRRFKMPSLVQTGAGEALYLLVSKEDLPMEYELFCFDLTSGASGRVALDHAVMLIPFQEGKLAALVQKMDASYRIVAIDAAGRQAETALFDDPDPQYTISGMVYDKDKGRLFVATGMGIFEVAEQKLVEQGVYLPELPERELNRDYHFFLAGKYVFINQKVFFESSLAQEAAAKSLRFANADQDSAIIRSFMKENPDVRLSFDRDTYWNPREIAETLLARDSGIDIIRLYAGSGLSAITQKKYYANLSGIAGLKEDIALMYPQIREILMDGEAVVAYPSSMTAYSWLVDEEALARMGYQAQGANMEGWMRFVEETARGFNPEEAPFTFFPPGFDRRQLISSLLKQYVGEYESADQLSFDNPVLKDILERALRLPEEILPEASMEGSSPEAYDAGRPPLFVMDTPLSPDSHIGFFQDYRPRYVAPPVFSCSPPPWGRCPSTWSTLTQTTGKPPWALSGTAPGTRSPCSAFTWSRAGINPSLTRHS